MLKIRVGSVGRMGTFGSDSSRRSRLGELRAFRWFVRSWCLRGRGGWDLVCER